MSSEIIHTTIWECPSNIAIVKYWGKKEIQIPMNPSISFTLKNSKTITKIYWRAKNENKLSFSFKLEGIEKPNFYPKIQKLLELTAKEFPFINDYFLEIESKNTFPHSTGIASSASGMGALALCFAEIIAKTKNLSEIEMKECASNLARLGSGSACRSIFGPITLWGETNAINNSSNQIAIKLQNTHSVFDTYQDYILIIDPKEKEVSSTIGHSLMNNHPFANGRIDQAIYNIKLLSEILENGDLTGLTNLAENEALSLHALMLSSNPSFVLMAPNTLEAIKIIRSFRNTTQTPVCFTLDAGANVHVLFPEHCKDFIDDNLMPLLKPLCFNNSYICDQVGFGPNKLIEWI